MGAGSWHQRIRMTHAHGALLLETISPAVVTRPPLTESKVFPVVPECIMQIHHEELHCSFLDKYPLLWRGQKVEDDGLRCLRYSSYCSGSSLSGGRGLERHSIV